jgi:hypothetical protein
MTPSGIEPATFRLVAQYRLKSNEKNFRKAGAKKKERERKRIILNIE